MDERGDDRELMGRIAGGDEGALAALVERHGARLQAIARRILGSRADGEDAVQQAFMRCWLHAADYRPDWAPSTWLSRILMNACVDEMRRREASTAREQRATTRPTRASQDDDIDLRRALDRVPREARILLALRYGEGLSHAELARVRGISINTVKSQLARGKSILRAALDGRGTTSAPRRKTRRS
jgi:RNA polymerase sigma-70 factor (ECF subfamily)